MNILENNTGIVPEKLFGVAGRENNQKRGHLLVNFLQGKHVPVRPTDSLALFARLGDLLAQRLSERKVLVVGFAETATAIGAAVAASLPTCMLYVHTTREMVSAAERIVDFNEEHSHAVEQILFCREWDIYAREADCILFVEDEITTGKTILNFIQALITTNRVAVETSFAVASLINGMNEASAAIFHERGVDCHYLMRFECNDFSPYLTAVPSVAQDVAVESADAVAGISVTDISGHSDARVGVDIRAYCRGVDDLAQEIIRGCELMTWRGESILVLGTEEFMYPVISVADKIAELLPKANVLVHATTRSPIVAFANASYPLQSRYRLRSMYEAARRTFVYNLSAYDKAIIITDAIGDTVAGVSDLTGALWTAGCRDISVVRWVK